MQRLSSRVCAVSRHGHQVWVHSLRSTRTRWRLPEEILPTMVTDGSPRGRWHSISAHNCRSLTAGICSLPWGFPYVLQMVDTWMKDLHFYYGPAWERTRDKDVRKHYAQLVNEFNCTKHVCVCEREIKRERRDRELNMGMGTGEGWQCGTLGAAVVSPCKQPCIMLGTELVPLQECIKFSCRATWYYLCQGRGQLWKEVKADSAGKQKVLLGVRDPNKNIVGNDEIPVIFLAFTSPWSKWSPRLCCPHTDGKPMQGALVLQSFNGFSLESEENTLPPPTPFLSHTLSILGKPGLSVIAALTTPHFTLVCQPPLASQTHSSLVVHR